MKRSKRAPALLLSLMLLTALLCGCGRQKAETEPAPSVSPTASASVPEAAAEAERADGERFEAVIEIEGMAETIQLQHIRNETAGFAMDFDCEFFVRESESDRECFVWGYDDVVPPENYLEVSYSKEDAETVAAAVSEALSRDYAVTRETVTLDRAGDSIRLDASAAADGSGTTEVLQAVYIIPAPDGCRVARLHYIAEGSDGFGRRLSYLVNTISVMEAQGERSLSDDEALAAVRRYCCAVNPELADMISAGEYPIGWEIESGDAPQIVVLFRSYTGAEVRYHIDPVSGQTDVTEFMPGISAEEEPTGEQINMWDYLDWWRS